MSGWQRQWRGRRRSLAGLVNGGGGATFLALVDIGDEGAHGRAAGAGECRGIEKVGREGAAQELQGDFAIGGFGRDGGGYGVPGGSEEVFFREKLSCGIGEQQFGRGDAGQFVGEALGGQIGHKSFAGGNIGPGEGEVGIAMPDHGEGSEIIGRAGVEMVVLGQGAGGDEADDVAFDDRLAAALLGFGGVFNLLADGDAVAEFYELVEIVIGRVDRHAAHLDVFAKMLAALGEDDPEGRAGDLGVFEEELVEIAHAIEQQIARIDRFDLEILRHHRRQRRRGGAVLGLERGLVHELG